MAAAGTGRDDWITAAMTLLGHGVSPAEMDVSDLCAAMPHAVTRGSFNWHFRAGRLAELHREVIGRWQAGRTAACDAVRTVREPLVRLRILRDAAATHGPADRAMRRWAGAPSPGPAAGDAEREVRRQLADAIAQVDKAITAHLDAALADLGFSGGEAAVLAATLAAAFAAAGAADQASPVVPDAFETLLTVLRRAAGPAEERKVQVIAGDDGEMLLVLAARNLAPGQLAELRQAARQFLARAGQ